MNDQTIFQIIHNMDKVTNDLIVQWNKSFAQDLGISHILVLGHLMMNGNSRPSDIARQLGLTPATLTHLANKLVKKEFVDRVADPSDRRITYLKITEKGLETLNRANEAGRKLRKNLFAKLDDEETRQLLAIYEKLNSDTEQ